MELCKKFVRGFVECCWGRNERNSSVEIRSALIFARNAIVWSQKFKEDQFREMRDQAAVAPHAESQRMESIANLKYTYDGVQLDKINDRPLIQDFLDHAEWYLSAMMKDRFIPGLMLKAIFGGQIFAHKEHLC